MEIEREYLKLEETGNAKYRRPIRSEKLQVLLGKRAVEWSLKTRDPLKIVAAWEDAHARFEALLAKAEAMTIEQIEWEKLHGTATDYGLAKPDTGRIGPVDSQLEAGRFAEFKAAALKEAEKLTPQQLNAPLANNQPPTAFDLLLKAQIVGVERPPVLLSAVVKAYLKDRERKASYDDISKQVALVVSGLEEAMGRSDSPLKAIDVEAAYAYRDSLINRGNAYGTVRRRITTIKAVLNHGKKRFGPAGWSNPFNGIELPQDDGEAGEVKRDPLTLEDIRKVRDKHSGLNEDARDIWHLMLFTGLGPNEARGLQWSDIYLDDPTPHFEVKPNRGRRVKVGERRRRVPLVGTALKMMKARREAAPKDAPTVFPRYAAMRNANALSATLVKPMKQAKVWVKTSKVPYSLRHTIKDWLRRTSPTNIQLLIFGHGHGEGRVANGYGGDDLLDRQAQYLEKALTLGGVINYPELPAPQSPSN